MIRTFLGVRRPTNTSSVHVPHKNALDKRGRIMGKILQSGYSKSGDGTIDIKVEITDEYIEMLIENSINKKTLVGV